jgi:hypothetical protein
MQGEETTDDGRQEGPKRQYDKIVSFVSEIDGRPRGSRNQVVMEWVCRRLREISRINCGRCISGKVQIESKLSPCFYSLSASI